MFPQPLFFFFFLYIFWVWTFFTQHFTFFHPLFIILFLSSSFTFHQVGQLVQSNPTASLAYVMPFLISKINAVSARKEDEVHSIVWYNHVLETIVVHADSAALVLYRPTIEGCIQDSGDCQFRYILFLAVVFLPTISHMFLCSWHNTLSFPFFFFVLASVSLFLTTLCLFPFLPFFFWFSLVHHCTSLYIIVCSGEGTAVLFKSSVSLLKHYIHALVGDRPLSVWVC